MHPSATTAMGNVTKEALRQIASATEPESDLEDLTYAPSAVNVYATQKHQDASTDPMDSYTSIAGILHQSLFSTSQTAVLQEH